MRTQSEDTHPTVEAAWISMLRKATPSQKFAQIRTLSRTTLSLSRRAISRKNATLNENEINYLFIEYHYGKNLANRYRDYIEKRSHAES